MILIKTHKSTKYTTQHERTDRMRYDLKKGFTIEVFCKLTTASGCSALMNSAAIFHLQIVNQAVPVYVSPAFKYSTGGPSPVWAALLASFTLKSQINRLKHKTQHTKIMIKAIFLIDLDRLIDFDCFIIFTMFQVDYNKPPLKFVKINTFKCIG